MMEDFKCPLCSQELVAYNMIGGRVYCLNKNCKIDYLEAHLKQPSSAEVVRE